MLLGEAEMHAGGEVGEVTFFFGGAYRTRFPATRKFSSVPIAGESDLQP
jgi:hypothetical protein